MTITMKVFSAMFGAAASLSVLLACSSSSSGGSVPSCQGNAGTSGAGSAACNTCLEGNCGSQTSSVESSCSAYISCYNGCQCSDTSCISGCQSKIDSTCSSAYSPLTSCLTKSCATQCGGAAAGDAG